MSILSKIQSFFTSEKPVNSAVYTEKTENYAQNGTTAQSQMELGTYDMPQTDFDSTYIVPKGTDSVEDMSALLEIQSRRYSRELTI